MNKRNIALILVTILLLISLSGCLQEEKKKNRKPEVEISYPADGAIVSSFLIISGNCSDPDGNETVERIEVKVGGNEWSPIKAAPRWSYHLNTNELADGYYTVKVRAWDGVQYSDVKEITIRIDNPEMVKTGSHKWALFVAAANFPPDNESKLGNGGLKIAEEMAAYLIEKCGYSTENIIILFDDGWIRTNNGYGKKIKTLQERKHEYDITYDAATKENVIDAINYITEKSNRYQDSEVFIWFFGHGVGDKENNLTGGKILETSKIFLWDTTLTDSELGGYLSNLKSKETCIAIDACFSGGFADKTIYNLPEFFLFNSNIPKSGRVVITGTSKFRIGYASTKTGPVFTNLWFEGIETGQADGFQPGFLNSGKPTELNMFKDGKVSVEEAFYFAKYVLRTNKELEKFRDMQPQISDRYPKTLANKEGLVLG